MKNDERIKAIESRLTEFQEAVEALATRMAAVCTLIQSIQHRISNMSRMMETSATLNAKRAENVQVLLARITALESRLNAAEARIQQLEAK